LLFNIDGASLPQSVQSLDRIMSYRRYQGHAIVFSLPRRIKISLKEQSFSYSVGIKVTSEMVKMQGLEINHSSHLLWWLRIRGAISPLPNMPS